MLKPIYDSTKGKMRVAGLVSGSGSSFRTIIEQQIQMKAKGGCPYEVVGIFSDNPKLEGKTVQFIFTVLADGPAVDDWAVWNSPIVTR